MDGEGTGRPRRSRCGVLTAWLLIAMGAVLAACGTTTAISPRLTPTVHPTPTATATTTTSASPIATATPSSDPVDAAIINAYEQGQEAVEAAAAVPNPNYPALATWLTGSALAQARSTPQTLAEQGEIYTGSQQFHPMVISVSATTATVSDCLYSTIVVVYQTNHQPVPGQPGGTQPEWDQVTMTMTLANPPGTWQQSFGTEDFGSSCRPAS